MVAGFRNPPQSQRGGLRFARKNSNGGSGSPRHLQVWHLTSRTRYHAIPPIAQHSSRREHYKPSMFCVTTASTFPARSNLTMASWTAFGRAVQKSVPALELVIPMFDPSRLRRHEVLEINRLAPCPHPLRPAEVRIPLARRYPGTGEDERPSRRARDNRPGRVIGERC